MSFKNLFYRLVKIIKFSSEYDYIVRRHFFFPCVTFEYAMWNNGRPKKEISINILLNSFLVALVLLRSQSHKNCYDLLYRANIFMNFIQFNYEISLCEQGLLHPRPFHNSRKIKQKNIKYCAAYSNLMIWQCL